MPALKVSRRGTALVDSDVNELIAQNVNAHSYWVLNAAIALSTTTYSASAFAVLVEGSIDYYTASTGAGFTAITIGTGNVAIVAAYITVAGTHIVVAGATAASFGVANLPVVPSTGRVYGVILLKASGASAFTGGTTVLDGTNASAVFVNMNGPAGIAFQTAPINVVPG